jgi:uncharacterized peroxidase-related enzyme
VSWIRSVAPEQASGALAETYAGVRAASSRGAVSSFWQALGLDPAGAAALHALYRTLMLDPAPLARAQAEMIAVAVSATNGCGYCVAHHVPRLAAALGDAELARAVARDYREADLAARDRVLLDHAVAVTCEPAERTAADLERLREYGFDDAAILRATEIAALYALANRLASALGVALEPGVEPWAFDPAK